MVDPIKVKNYFNENSESWVKDAYKHAGCNYLTPFHRVRAVKNIIKKLENIQSLLDVGCGAGHLALSIADLGIQVRGIDQNKKMIQQSQTALSRLTESNSGLLSFELKSVDQLGLEENNYDAITAMGVIGYLNSDEALFKAASRNLSQHGYLIVSFRNRLFNLFSISKRTLAEVNKGTFGQLMEEIDKLYEKIDNKIIFDFISELHAVTGEILEDKKLLLESNQSPREEFFTSDIEARQTTPRDAEKTAKKCGFESISFTGIHPHLSVPKLNKILPPQIYNRLCDSLIPFENSPESLLWSSVFIGVFQKIE
jgi:2-polyprenyl-3-methyl-5-hydroxy-6-metoxy-1,4-benzoquinol methylase